MNGTTELYLTFETGSAAPDADAARLRTVLDAVTVASVLIRPGASAPLDARAAGQLVAVLQKRGITALIADDASLARTAKADGVHLSWSADTQTRYGEARDSLGAGAIIGADAGRSRHDAMLLAEAGADYIAFGIPAHVGDRATAEARQLDLVEWWSEIFEPPCVAFDVADATHARALAASGADFVAVTIAAALTEADIARTARAFAEAIDLSGVPA